MYRRTLSTRVSRQMYLLSEREVEQALNLQDCLDATRQAFVSITQKTAAVPTRLGLPYPHNPNLAPPSPPSSDYKINNPDADADADAAATTNPLDWTLFKPAAYYGGTDGDSDIAMGLKIVSIRAANPSMDLPLVPATIILLDPVTGMVDATLGGTYLTVARTSAGPALAVQTFCPHLQELVLFGAGAQAACHVQLMQLALQRTIPKITIVNRSIERAKVLRDKLIHQNQQQQQQGQEQQEIHVVPLSDHDAVNAALSTADVVSTTTNTVTPLWQDGSILKPNCLITGIGSYTPDMQEIPASAVNRCHVIIDTPEARDVGDLKHLSPHHPVTLAGHAFENPTDILPLDATTAPIDCIFYKAVGTAIHDVLTARAVVERAKQLGIGQEVDMG